MIAQGIPTDYAEAVLAQILGFGEYGFPESHAASFALLVYVSGWVKCHHPAAFAAALLNSQPMGFYDAHTLVADAQRHGVAVRPVCAQRSAWDCTLETDGASAEAPALRLGLRQIHGMSLDEAHALLAARAIRPFTGVLDVAARAGLSRARLQTLAEAGAMAQWEPDRRQAAWTLQGAWTDLPLFATLSRREPTAALPPLDATERLMADYATTGLSVDQHPAGLLRPFLNARRAIPLAELTRVASGARVRVGGLVVVRQRPPTASGVTFLTLEDESGLANLVVWPAVWARYRKLARGVGLLGVDATLQRQADAINLVVQAMWPLPAPPSARDPDQNAPTRRSRDFH
jgi:error-prone DNA polymerase